MCTAGEVKRWEFCCCTGKPLSDNKDRSGAKKDDAQWIINNNRVFQLTICLPGSSYRTRKLPVQTREGDSGVAVAWCRSRHKSI